MLNLRLAEVPRRPLFENQRTSDLYRKSETARYKQTHKMQDFGTDQILYCRPQRLRMGLQFSETPCTILHLTYQMCKAKLAEGIGVWVLAGRTSHGCSVSVLLDHLLISAPFWKQSGPLVLLSWCRTMLCQKNRSSVTAFCKLFARALPSPPPPPPLPSKKKETMRDPWKQG